MILVILINIPIARKSDALTMKQMRYKDERIKLMNEILSGIKVGIITHFFFFLTPIRKMYAVVSCY